MRWKWWVSRKSQCMKLVYICREAQASFVVLFVSSIDYVRMFLPSDEYT